MENDEIVVVETTANVAPVLEANKVTVMLEQDTVKLVTRKGEKVEKKVQHHMAFSDSIKTALTSEMISTFICAKLAQYQIMQSFQGKAKFDQSLPITVSIMVNDEARVSGLKFSTNPKSLEKILDKYPQIVSLVFNPQSYGLGTKKSQVLQLVDKGYNAVLAPAIPDAAQEVQNLINADVETLEVVE